MGHVARAPWDMLRGLHGTCCEGSMEHVARAPWNMLRGLHGTCCEGSMGHVARVPWTCCKGFMGHVETCCKAPCDMLQGLHFCLSYPLFKAIKLVYCALSALSRQATPSSLHTEVEVSQNSHPVP